jgi:enoyl-CoA hydratase
VPVIAAVNGPAIGGGTQLAIACDLRVAAPEARFAVPTARLGVAVDPWTVRRLEQVAGGALARAILIGCETVGPELAHTRGLVDRLGTPADAHAWAAELAGLAPLTLAYNKLVLDRVELGESDPALTAAFDACWASSDVEEGRSARAEKRAPAYVGH